MAYQFKPSPASAWLDKVVGEFSYLGTTNREDLLTQYEKRNPGFYCNIEAKRYGYRTTYNFTKTDLEAKRNFGVNMPLFLARHGASYGLGYRMTH